ncbi:hypothetical protein HK102_001555 [Quaeritorhiza haematococci]|nr:hypothetical protein HK102_001555 [Quaeritorhiza haematococci]
MDVFPCSNSSRGGYSRDSDITSKLETIIYTNYALNHIHDLYPGVFINSATPLLHPHFQRRPDNREPGYSYKETGAFSAYWPTGCVVEVPVFEKLDQAEEARLGIVGIKKTPVAKLILVGDCQYGCAKVTLMEMRLLKLDGEFVWEWKKETNGKK